MFAGSFNDQLKQCPTSHGKTRFFFFRCSLKNQPNDQPMTYLVTRDPSISQFQGSKADSWASNDHQIALVVAQLLAGHHGFATSGVTLPKVVLGNLAVHWTHLQICFLPELHLENQELGWDEHGLHRNLSAHLVEVLDNLHEWWIGRGIGQLARQVEVEEEPPEWVK
jgi:hypothetical protein